MADTEILANPDELRNHAAAIKTQADNSEADFKAMRARLDALGSEFRGQSAKAFQTRWDEWHSHATGLVQALGELGHFLEGAANTIEGTDTQIAQGLSG